MKSTVLARHVDRLRQEMKRIATHLEIAASHDANCAAFEKDPEAKRLRLANVAFLRGEASLLHAAAEEGIG